MSLFPALTGTPSAIPLPNTAPTPAAGELVRAADIQDAVQALLDQDAALATVGFRRVSLWAHDSESPIPAWVFNSTSYAPNTTDSSAWRVDLSNALAGDVIVISASFAIDAVPTTDCFIRLGATDNFGGMGASEVQVPGFRLAADNAQLATTIATRHTVVTSGTCRIRLLGKYSGSGPSFSVVGFGEIVATLLRPTGSAA